jgi:putative ABC transport system ATP-binding protein
MALPELTLTGNQRQNISTASSQPLIRMEKIVKSFKTAAGEFIVLKGIDACIDRGEFVSVVGKSGSGKSTLMNMVTGIDRPTAGIIRVGGVVLNELDESRMSLWRGQNLGIVFQFFQLLPMLSLLENVLLPMDLARRGSIAEREARAHALLERMGLAGFENKFPAAVSGGQQQTAAIARALANDPPILIADEPTGNLDTRTAGMIVRLFEELAAQGKTILMVTHDLGLARHASRILHLVDGQITGGESGRLVPGAPGLAAGGD